MEDRETLGEMGEARTVMQQTDMEGGREANSRSNHQFTSPVECMALERL